MVNAFLPPCGRARALALMTLGALSHLGGSGFKEQSRKIGRRGFAARALFRTLNKIEPLSSAAAADERGSAASGDTVVMVDAAGWFSLKVGRKPAIRRGHDVALTRNPHRKRYLRTDRGPGRPLLGRADPALHCRTSASACERMPRAARSRARAREAGGGAGEQGSRASSNRACRRHRGRGGGGGRGPSSTTSFRWWSGRPAPAPSPT